LAAPLMATLGARAVELVEALRRSPNGSWRPARYRRSTTWACHGQVRRAGLLLLHPVAGVGDSPRPTSTTPGTQPSEAGERVEGDGGGRGYVQRIDPVHDGDGHHHVGRGQGGIRQARPLGTEDQGHPDGVI